MACGNGYSTCIYFRACFFLFLFVRVRRVVLLFLPLLVRSVVALRGPPLRLARLTPSRPVSSGRLSVSGVFVRISIHVSIYIYIYIYNGQHTYKIYIYIYMYIYLYSSFHTFYEIIYIYIIYIYIYMHTCLIYFYCARRAPEMPLRTSQREGGICVHVMKYSH